MDVIRTVYYIHGPWGDENIFAVLYVSLCYGPYTFFAVKQQFFYIYLLKAVIIGVLQVLFEFAEL